MTLYPAKDRKGIYTGMWVVDGMSKGVFERLRTHDFKEAQRAERHLRRGQSLKSFGREVVSAFHEDHESQGPYTLARLAVEAARRFEGTGDERQNVRRLQAVVDLLGPDTDIKAILPRHLEKVASDLCASGKSRGTANRMMAAISGALKWARRNELLDREPLKCWQREGKGRVHFVPGEQDARLVAWMEEHGRERQALVYQVLVSTGLRVGELRNLKPHEVEPEWLRLAETKNGDHRDVPISQELSQALRALIEAKTMPTYEAIRSTFVKAGGAVGLEFHLTPHVLRHTTATRLNDKGVSTATIKQFLGHRNVRTTLRYAHVTGKSLQEAARLLRSSEPEELEVS